MTARWWLAFVLLVLVMHEAHELAHTVTGWAVCGEWAARDFNVWRLSPACTSLLPTAAGPLFSYALMLLGVWLCTRGRRAVGLAILFAANPFARLFTAAMGGGDEMVVARRMVEAPRPVTIVVVGAITIFVIVAGWRATAGLRRRVLTFLGLLLSPMIVTGVLLFVLFNRLLGAGVLATPIIGGAPLFVWIVTSVVVVLFAGTARWLRNDQIRSLAVS